MFVFAVRSRPLGGLRTASPDVWISDSHKLLAGPFFSLSLLLSVDLRAFPSPRPLLMKLSVDSKVNEGHLSLNAASSKRTLGKKGAETGTPRLLGLLTVRRFLFHISAVGSLVIGHTWVSAPSRPDTEVCKQKTCTSHLAFKSSALNQRADPVDHTRLMVWNASAKEMFSVQNHKNLTDPICNCIFEVFPLHVIILKVPVFRLRFGCAEACEFRWR